jgi:hypothetical protein
MEKNKSEGWKIKISQLNARPAGNIAFAVSLCNPSIFTFM